MSDEAFDPAAVAVRPAATVMLVRDAVSGDGIEVFMLKRTSAAAFAASQYVFPGGRVDDVDAAGTMERWCDGRDDAGASALLTIPSGGLGYWVAAIRECFEEAGVLLARHAATGDIVSFGEADTASRYSTYRREVHGGRLHLAELCSREDLRLVTDSIGYVSHWITPYGERRRFDARFFIARAPEAQDPLHDDLETVESLWVRPADALDRHRRGDLAMYAPTVSNLRFLADHRSATSALAASATTVAPAPVAAPKVQVDLDGKVVNRLLPGHPGFDAAPDYSVLD